MLHSKIAEIFHVHDVYFDYDIPTYLLITLSTAFYMFLPISALDPFLF